MKKSAKSPVTHPEISRSFHINNKQAAPITGRSLYSFAYLSVLEQADKA